MKFRSFLYGLAMALSIFSLVFLILSIIPITVWLFGNNFLAVIVSISMMAGIVFGTIAGVARYHDS